ncbi:NfeD family protein [Laceyella tengchongensis]
MFFVSLTLILLLAVAGGILLVQGLMLEGSACLVASGVLFWVWFIYYKRRRKKCDDFDCGCDVFDCDCVDCNCVDCNCSD